MKKQLKILAIWFIIGFLGVIGIIIQMPQLFHHTEESTTLFTGTVSSVDVTEKSDEFGTKIISIHIYTNEFKPYLLLEADSQYIEKDDIALLESGQTIYFRVWNAVAKQQQEDEGIFIGIVSLETTSKSIYSLEEYNQRMGEHAHFPIIAACVVALLLLTGAVACFLKLKKISTPPPQKTEDGSVC